jgi:hypothetical protein
MRPGPGPHLQQAAVDVRLVRRQERTEVDVVRVPRALKMTVKARALWLKSFRRRESVACHCVGVPEVQDERELRLTVQRQPRDGAVRDALQSRQEREQDPTRRDT